MKYVIIIPDGAADDPLVQLDNLTPLEAAHKPNMDRVAAQGCQGTASTVPEGFESGSDVATMSLLGYDPARYHTGRAPLEAAAQRIALSPSDWVFRCNLVTVIDGVMKDHSAGGISSADARELLETLRHHLPDRDFELFNGVSYRNLLVYRGSQRFDVVTRPPHEIPDEAIDKWLPRGEGSDRLRALMSESARLFADHPVTGRRGKSNPATQVWLWGQGHAPDLPSFAKKFGVKSGCMITGVDLLRGLAALIGWDVREVAGMTSFHDTDYAAQGEATANAVDEYDLVLSHIEAPDEASHQADWKTKIASIESIDRHIVGPVLEKLSKLPEWRLMILPDHPTNIATRKHGYSPTCFTICGTGIKPDGLGSYCEPHAAQGRRFPQGHDLMNWFLHGR